MITAGCDVGSLTAKAVLLKDGKILASEVVLVSANPERAAAGAMEEAMRKAGVSRTDIDCCIGTGYGRRNIPFADGTESEIACHAKAAVWMVPSVRTVVDIGGQDAKAIKVDGKGNVLRYVYNDKCASGTGRFLEIIAEAMDLGLEEMGPLSLKSANRLTLSNQCVIFAETEIISLMNDGKEAADIVNALHHAVANRASSLARSLVVEDDVAMTGGVARNPGMFAAMEEALGKKIIRMEHPQIMGALGAALFAQETVKAGMV